MFITATGDKNMCERVGNYGKLGNLSDKGKKIENYYQVLRDYRDNITPYCKDCLYVRVCGACFSLCRERNKVSQSNWIEKSVKKRKSGLIL